MISPEARWAFLFGVVIGAVGISVLRIGARDWLELMFPGRFGSPPSSPEPRAAGRSSLPESSPGPVQRTAPPTAAEGGSEIGVPMSSVQSPIAAVMSQAGSGDHPLSPAPRGARSPLLGTCDVCSAPLQDRLCRSCATVGSPPWTAATAGGGNDADGSHSASSSTECGSSASMPAEAPSPDPSPRLARACPPYETTATVGEPSEVST